MKQLTKHDINNLLLKSIHGGSFSPALTGEKTGLSATSPATTDAGALRAFRFYPCRGSRLRLEKRSTTALLFPLIITLFNVLCNVPATAQVIPLDSVLALVEENPMLAEYDKKAQALEAYASGATSWMAPMVGAGRFMTPYRYKEAMHENEKGSWMFSVEQEVPNPAKLSASRRYLSSKAAVEKENRAIQRNALYADAKSLYYRWLVAEEKTNTLKESEAIVKLMLEIARVRYPYNQGSLANIYRTEARLAEVQNMIEMNLGDIDEITFRLKGLMNMPIDRKIVVDTTTNISFTPAQEFYDTTRLATLRSDIRRIDKTIEVMRLNQRMQRKQAQPDFKIRFDHMQPIGDMPKQYTAMAMVSIPIAPWSSKMYRAEIKGMEYDIEAMRKNREAILTETQGMLAGMTAQLLRMQRQLANYKETIIPALRKNHQAMMLAYEENKETLPNVVEAWEAMNMASLEYLDKKTTYYDMIVAYEKALENDN